MNLCINFFLVSLIQGLLIELHPPPPILLCAAYHKTCRGQQSIDLHSWRTNRKNDCNLIQFQWEICGRWQTLFVCLDVFVFGIGCLRLHGEGLRSSRKSIVSFNTSWAAATLRLYVHCVCQDHSGSSCSEKIA